MLTLGCCPAQRLIDRVFDRARTKLSTSGAELVLVEVDQVLGHRHSIYGVSGVYLCLGQPLDHRRTSLSHTQPSRATQELTDQG
jgi:hypothetical protein